MTEEPRKPSEAVTTREGFGNKTNSQTLRGDLDNIVLKAIRKETDRRYRSVQEFADDIERYLKGLPVTATADSRSYRLKKFVRRHRRAVFPAVGFMVLLITATALTGWQYFRAQHAQAQAEKRFNDVRKLANSVVFELHDSIQNLPGATPTRELLVRRALEYLDELGKEAENDTELQTELADAYDKIGDVQGGYGQLHLGQRDNAKKSYQKAFAIREKLLMKNPQNPRFRAKIAASYHNLGDMLFLEGNIDESLSDLKKSLGFYEELLKEEPNNVDLKMEYAEVLDRAGFLFAAHGKMGESDEYSLKGIAVKQELVDSNPNEIDFRFRLAKSFNNYGQIINGVKEDYENAEKYHKRAFEILEKLHAENPQNVLFKYRYSGTHYYRGMVSYNLSLSTNDRQKKLEGLDYLTKAQEITTELSETDPQNQLFQSDIAQMASVRSFILVEIGEPEKAIRILEKSLENMQRRSEQEPNNKSLLANIADANSNMGDAYFKLASEKTDKKSDKLKYFETAKKYYQDGFKILKVYLGSTFIAEEKKAQTLQKEIEECDKAIAKLK